MNSNKIISIKKFERNGVWEAANRRLPAEPGVWIMRQAGRYLPQYRKLREKFQQFMDFCAEPDIVTEVTLQPVDAIGVDAAILFSDILVLLPPLGLSLSFHEGKGPVIANPLRSEQQVQQLKAVDVQDSLAYVLQSIKQIKAALGTRVPLLGFAGGPFTVASYMVEGGSSKELAQLKKMMFSDPKAFHSLMDKITTVTIDYLTAQSRAGADILVVMDSWAGYLNPEDYQNFVFPFTSKVFQAVKIACPDCPLLHYANGASSLLPQFSQLGADALGLDWRCDLREVLQSYPNQVFQGNLDPCTLFAPVKTIQAKTRQLKQRVEGRAHIFNLGHGILPQTPVDAAKAFVDTIHEG